MTASVSLSSTHDSRSYPPPAAPERGYPPDLWYASPNAVNGYPPPGQISPPGQQQPPYLLPLQAQTDPRSPIYPPPDQRGGYYDDRHPPPPGYGQKPYSSDPYYAYLRQPPQSLPPPNGFRDYRAHLASGVYEYPPGGPGAAPQLTQASPRVRAFTACRYCRHRKIRCSGYQSAPGGKCQNCARKNLKCIFQSFSLPNPTAFIPDSAVPGAIPPDTQLFSAYGQPLAPSSVPAPHPPGPYQQHPSGAPPRLGKYYPPVQSPTESFSSYGDARTGDGSQVAGRRRRRTSHEQEEGYRLPPPKAAVEEDPRRRFPAEFSNHSSPGGICYPPYSGARQSPRNPGGNALPQPAPGASYVASAPGGRSPTAQNGCSGASTLARQGQNSSQQPQPGNSSVMSLSNLVEKNDIDKTMIDRQNRPGPSPNQNGRRDASR